MKISCLPHPLCLLSLSDRVLRLLTVVRVVCVLLAECPFDALGGVVLVGVALFDALAGAFLVLSVLRAGCCFGVCCGFVGLYGGLALIGVCVGDLVDLGVLCAGDALLVACLLAPDVQWVEPVEKLELLWVLLGLSKAVLNLLGVLAALLLVRCCLFGELDSCLQLGLFQLAAEVFVCC